jgi:predicted Zn-dependent protease
MKVLKRISLFAVTALALILFACQKEDVKTNEVNNEVPQKVLEKISSLELNTDGVTKKFIEFLDGTGKEMYIVEGDIAIDPEKLDNMHLYEGITGEQYRTHNLVNVTGSKRKITVIGYTGGSNALTAKMKTGLQWAINNYNRLNLKLEFELTFGTDYQDKDIVIYVKSNGSGAIAGFPEDGNPFWRVIIYSDMAGYNENVLEHVIGHEIGHCIGLRHTDWATRQSCGGYSPEPANPYGAVHIPGTGTAYQSDSYMKACFNGYEDGEFNDDDIVALKYLY